MINIALLGYGTVGRGVYEIISGKKPIGFSDDICVKKILVRDLGKKREGNAPAEIFTDSFNEILNDGTIKAAVCVMGGFEPEYSYIRSFLSRGVSVITANKEIVSKDIKQLLKLAKDNGAKFMFEASVGGGIPIISSLAEILKINNITRINGILNGTTNYILTRLSREKHSFEEILKDAQRLGFAEANPSADIDGYDIMRKIVILSSIAFKTEVKEENVHLRGLSNITKSDILMAESFGFTVKYIAQGILTDGRYSVSVTPVLLKKDSVISNVNEEYNIILVEGDIIGKQCFMGKGAGKNATADAVVTDLIKALNRENTYDGFLFEQNIESAGIEGIENEYYLRVRCADFKALNKILLFIGKYISKNKMVFSEDNLYLISERIKSTDMKNLYTQLQNISDDVFYARLENNLL